jgi:hypothetical protein
LAEFEKRARQNRLPQRFAHVVSMERLRTWSGLEEVIAIGEPLSLAIVDEAHVMRNSTTRNFEAGYLLSEWAEALVLTRKLKGEWARDSFPAQRSGAGMGCGGEVMPLLG